MAKDREGRTLSKEAGKGAGQALSEEERALWEHAARSLKPLKGKERVAQRKEPVSHGSSAATKSPSKPKSPHRSVAPPKPATAGASTPPPLSELDRRKARQIGSGRIEVEARIDLHGLRQSEAHAALNRFLARAHAEGRRWVLVITGKGGALRGSAEATDEEGYGSATERGILKRNVPRWLDEPELRAIVVGFTTAAVRHGGEGALYVQLRKRRPDSGDRA